MTPAIRAAERAGIAFEVLEYAHSRGAPSYGLEAAAALGVPAARLFKTLIVQADANRLATALVPVSATLDLKAMADALGARRVALAAPESAERATGYVVGGISPLGQRRRLTTVIDRSVAGVARVYVSAGRRGLELALAPDDLIRLCGASLAPIAR